MKWPRIYGFIIIEWGPLKKNGWDLVGCVVNYRDGVVFWVEEPLFWRDHWWVSDWLSNNALSEPYLGPYCSVFMLGNPSTSIHSLSFFFFFKLVLIKLKPSASNFEPLVVLCLLGIRCMKSCNITIRISQYYDPSVVSRWIITTFI